MKHGNAIEGQADGDRPGKTEGQRRLSQTQNRITPSAIYVAADFGNVHLAYHIEFYRCGFNAMVKLWLRDGCKESPETMAEILKQEYHGR